MPLCGIAFRSLQCVLRPLALSWSIHRHNRDGLVGGLARPEQTVALRDFAANRRHPLFVSACPLSRGSGTLLICSHTLFAIDRRTFPEGFWSASFRGVCLAALTS